MMIALRGLIALAARGLSISNVPRLQLASLPTDRTEHMVSVYLC
jgi:hypothetical protein